MLKKIISAALTAMLALQASAGAYELKFNYESGTEGSAFAFIYDENGKLEAVEKCEAVKNDGACTAEISGGENKKIKLLFPHSAKLIESFITEESKDEIKDEIKEENKNESTEENKQNPYPTAMDAATAYMMVKEVGKTAEGDEIKTKLTVFFRGEEKSFLLDESAELDSASDVNFSMEGEPLTSLRAGDIIYCSTNLSGKIRTVELIYRPTDFDIVTDERNYGENFEDLYTVEGSVTQVNPTPIVPFGGSLGAKRAYALGLIRECGASYITLCNKSGLAKNNMDIDINENTVVYVYDKAKKDGNVRIGDISDIAASSFASEAEDEYGNITDMSNYFEHNYALVKMAEGTATEIALYLNY